MQRTDLAHDRTVGPPGPSSSFGCQVPGCEALLTHLRDYYQRYKICETHLKMESLLKDGELQRFCQQCGRFQPLGDFDDNKRSCRERLARHNAARRRRRGDAHAANDNSSPAQTDSNKAAPSSAPSSSGSGLQHMQTSDDHRALASAPRISPLGQLPHMLSHAEPPTGEAEVLCMQSAWEQQHWLMATSQDRSVQVLQDAMAQQQVQQSRHNLLSRTSLTVAAPLTSQSRTFIPQSGPHAPQLAVFNTHRPGLPPTHYLAGKAFFTCDVSASGGGPQSWPLTQGTHTILPRPSMDDTFCASRPGSAPLPHPTASHIKASPQGIRSESSLPHPSSSLLAPARGAAPLPQTTAPSSLQQPSDGSYSQAAPHWRWSNPIESLAAPLSGSFTEGSIDLQTSSQHDPPENRVLGENQTLASIWESIQGSE